MRLLGTIVGPSEMLAPLLCVATIAIVFAAILFRLACTIARVAVPPFGRACLIALIVLAIFAIVGIAMDLFSIQIPSSSRFSDAERVALMLGVGTTITAFYYRVAIPVERFPLAALVAAVNLVLYLGVGTLLWSVAEASRYLDW